MVRPDDDYCCGGCLAKEGVAGPWGSTQLGDEATERKKNAAECYILYIYVCAKTSEREKSTHRGMNCERENCCFCVF